jgi:hypothetical protein
MWLQSVYYIIFSTGTAGLNLSASELLAEGIQNPTGDKNWVLEIQTWSAPSLLPLVSCYPLQLPRCLQIHTYRCPRLLPPDGRKPPDPDLAWQQTGRVPAHGGMARSSFQGSSCGRREPRRAGSAGVIDDDTHGGCVMQRWRQTTQAFVLVSCVFFVCGGCRSWHRQRPGKARR